jgi:hypothetical protein
VETFHRILLDGLRATPGVILLTPDSEEAAENGFADYRLTVKGTGSGQANTFSITLRASMTGKYVQPYQLNGLIATECSGTPDCGDAIGMANRQVNLLRETLFPAARERPQEMRGRLLDAALGARQRLDALLALESLRSDGALPAMGRSPEGLRALRDPAVVRGALDLAAAASDDFVRAQVWKKMRGVDRTELIAPLVAAASADVSGNVRAEAVMTLAADFAGDPRVRAALETIARQDSRPVVRVLAQSGLAGKDAWPSHVVASLQDTSLSDLERLEAIYYAMNQSQARISDLRDVLASDESIRAFVQLLPRVVKTTVLREDRATASEMVTVLLTRLDAIDHPAVTDMLLDAWEHPGWADPFIVLNRLAHRSADPRVRAVLEKVGAEAADSPLRDIARTVLSKSAAPP